MTQPEQMAVERLGNLQFLSPDELRDAVELVLSLLRRYETALEQIVEMVNSGRSDKSIGAVARAALGGES